ncbi:MAG: hypothetical protein QNJ88_04240 [Acidimicrobiia bacterium]|nr:hypothetical protein [Acidimicrobiia bacterium]
MTYRGVLRPADRLSIRHLWVLVPFVALAIRAVTNIGDNSFLWHVRAGEIQLSAGEVLRSDPFSFTELGAPWRTQSWLLELLYGWLFMQSGGLQWVPAVIFLTMSATFVFLGLAVYRWVRDPVRTAIVLLVMAWVAFFFAVPRPVSASFLLLALMAVVLQNEERVGWAIVPILWLWAAVHGSWVVGGGLVVLEAARRRSWRLVELGAIGGVATLLTAHGIGTWQIFVSFLSNREALDFLSEWARPDYTNPFITPALLVVAAIAAAVIARRLPPQHLLVALPFAIFGALAMRSVFPALIVLVPYAAAAIAPPTDRTLRPKSGSPLLNKAFVGVLVLLCGVALARPIGIDQEKLPPEAAVDRLDDRPVFHGPAAGGLLIYAEWPDRLVFVDDRAELFGADGFGDVVDALEGRTYAALFETHDVGQALLEADWPLVDSLRNDGWQTAYEDEAWVVLGRP